MNFYHSNDVNDIIDIIDVVCDLLLGLGLLQNLIMVAQLIPLHTSFLPEAAKDRIGPDLPKK